MQSEYEAKIAELEADAETRDQELTVLMAHLKEARRPIESVEGDVKRLREELALKVTAIAELTEETDKLRAALERTRGALLGMIQTSMV